MVAIPETHTETHGAPNQPLVCVMLHLLQKWHLLLQQKTCDECPPNPFQSELTTPRCFTENPTSCDTAQSIQQNSMAYLAQDLPLPLARRINAKRLAPIGPPESGHHLALLLFRWCVFWFGTLCAPWGVVLKRNQRKATNLAGPILRQTRVYC